MLLLGEIVQSLVISTDEGKQPVWLKREPLDANRTGKDEKWLQQLLFDQPQLIPLDELLPGSSGFIPICRELSIPTNGRSVFLDLFGVTREGQLVLIECKLWRNPQARREVIAQILEYASLLRRWSYGDLVARIKKLTGSNHPNPLFEAASAGRADLDEASFVDRVTLSMQRGEFMLIIAGDGIRSDVHAIADHLNHSSGLASKLALVEFQLWQGDGGSTFVIPSIPVRSEVIQHRVFVDQSGLPLVSSSSDDEPEISGFETSVDQDASKDIDRAFWQTVIDAMQFDHPDQVGPRHGGRNFIRIPMPEPVGSLVAYRTKKGVGGFFFRLKGDLGERFFHELELAGNGLEAEIGAHLDMRQETSLPFQAIIECLYLGELTDEDAFRGWLADVANRLVGALRPMLSGFERA